jgi:hypothetical protein
MTGLYRRAFSRSRADACSFCRRRRECPGFHACPFSWFSPSLGGMAGDSGATAENRARKNPAIPTV